MPTRGSFFGAWACAAIVESGPGTSRTSRHVRFYAALGGEADISRRMQTDTIYEYAPYADE